MPAGPDFLVRDEGTLVLFTPRTPYADQWWEEQVQDAPRFGLAYAVEHRFAQPIFDGIVDAGFIVN